MKRGYLAFPLVLAIILFLSFFSILARAQDKQSGSATTQSATSQKSTDKSSASASDDDIMPANDPLFGVPKMPKGKTALVGGTVQKIDPIRQRITLRIFGNNKKMTLGYDERSHIYRDGVESTYRAVQPGERVYVDSMLDGTALFARNIRVVTTLRPADARGQITQYDARNGRMTIRDDLSSSPVTFRVTQQTQVKGSGADSSVNLVPGSLVTVHFSSDHTNRDVAQEVTVLAMPGAMFTFQGVVRHLDVKDGVMAVENKTDNKMYELQFDPTVASDDLTVGSDVTVAAEFEGKTYKAKSIKVNSSNKQASNNPD